MKYGYLQEYSDIDVLTNFNFNMFIEKIKKLFV